MQSSAVAGHLAGHVLFARLPVHHLIDFRIPFTSTADGFAFVKHRLVYGLCVALSTGVARGLWIQGIMFGLLHWGMSVGVVAALPTSLLIGVGAVFWGKAVIDTRGLSWVIIAHAMVDVAIMSAYFVPSPS